jgi:arylsulfatase A-like enzyme
MQSSRRLLVVLAGFAAACGSDAGDARPNVLLISLDSVRADFIGAYGARLPYAPGRSPSPNLDRLAAEGVLYEQAIATTSWTLPSHVSMLTGVPELVHGVEQDGQCIPPDLPTLAETLHERGYRTYGVYSGPYLDPRYGFARGFERYEAGYGPELARAADEVAVSEKLMASIDVEREPERAKVAVDRHDAALRALDAASHRDVSSQQVVDLVLAELERAGEDERPFFVFAHFFDPHYDYNPPAPYFDAFDPGYTGTVGPRDYFANPAILHADYDPANLTGLRRAVDDRGLEHLQALYAGEIAWTDSRIGILLDALDRRKLSENTLVVVVADHGEEFFEHGFIGHRRTLKEEVVRVPWIMRLPGKLPPGERRRGWKTLNAIRDEIPRLVEPAPPPRTSVAISLGRLVRVDMLRRTWPLPPVCKLPDVSTLEELSPEAREEAIKELVKAAAKETTAEGVLLTVVESFRHDSIKIERERSFARDSGPESAAMLQSYYGERLTEDDRLRWIDLDQHPDEPDYAWSTYFDDPRAYGALAEFRRAYAALLEKRKSPPVIQESSETLAMLRGLGYVGQEARTGTIAGDELVLPPPGEGMLGKDDKR